MPKKQEENSISAGAADRLIAAHDGDVALLYIYYRRRGYREAEQAAHDLCRTLREIEAAEEKLGRMGLLDGEAPEKAAEKKPPLPPADELPEYTSDEIVRRTSGDSAFACLADEASKVLGHVIGSEDLRRLFGIYDQLAMPPEVIMELLNYCGELAQSRSKNGAVVRPGMRRIVTEAYNWAKLEILTLPQAEEYIHKMRKRISAVGRLRSAMGLSDHAVTKTEEDYLSSWLDMGFDEQSVMLALDRTVAGTGGLKWAYMNTILKRWHEKGLHSTAEIEEKDPLHRGKRPGENGKSRAQSDTGPLNLEGLDDLYNKL